MAIFANRPPSTREIVSSVGLLFKFHPFKSYRSSHLPLYTSPVRTKCFIYRSVYGRATTCSWNLVVRFARFVPKEIGRIGQVVKRRKVKSESARDLWRWSVINNRWTIFESTNTRWLNVFKLEFFPSISRLRSLEKRIITFNTNCRNLISKKQKILNILGIDFILKYIYVDRIFWFYSFCFIYLTPVIWERWKIISWLNLLVQISWQWNKLYIAIKREKTSICSANIEPPCTIVAILLFNFTSFKLLINSERNFRCSKYKIRKYDLTPRQAFISKSVKFSVLPPCKVRSFVKWLISIVFIFQSYLRNWILQIILPLDRPNKLKRL